MNFGILHERAYGVSVYTPIKSRIKHCIFSVTDYTQNNFVFNIGVPRLYLDFFRFAKYRISAFNMKEHMKFVNITQNRVEKALYIFLTDYFQRTFVFNIRVPR